VSRGREIKLLCEDTQKAREAKENLEQEEQQKGDN